MRPGESSDLRFRHPAKWYLASLGVIAILLVLGQVLIQRHLAKQAHDSQVINLGGRQRMLAQRLAKVALMLRSYQSSEERERIADELSETLHVWQVTHLGLQFGNDSLQLPGSNSQTITELFKVIDLPFTQMQTGSKAVIEQLAFHQQVSMAYLQPHLNKILNNEQAYTTGMDNIVTQYANEANRKLTTLSRIEYLMLTVTLLSIGASIFYVFWPSARGAGATRK